MYDSKCNLNAFNLDDYLNRFIFSFNNKKSVKIIL